MLPRLFPAPALPIILAWFAPGAVFSQTVMCPVTGPNLITNGSFEQGYFGFTSDFGRGLNNATKGDCGTQGWILITQTDPHASPACQLYPAALSAQYGGPNTLTDPNPNHPSNTAGVTLATCNTPLPDHTSGAGFFLTIDPDAIPNRAYWKQRVPVCPNTNYVFSVWIRNISPGCGLPAPFFHFEVDGKPVNTPTQYPDCFWVQTATNWNSGNTQGSVWIELKNDQPGCNANDVAIDDVFFGVCGAVLLTSSVHFGFCGDSADAPITLSGYAVGFDPPQYQWEKRNPVTGLWMPLPGATDSMFLLQNPSAADAGQYRLAATAAGNAFVPGCMVTSPVIRIEAFPENHTELTVDICPGDSYAGHTDAGVYLDSFLSQNGCDSVRTLRLRVRETYQIADSAAICPGGAYSFNGKLLVEPGIYTAALSSIFGCDSTVTLTLRTALFRFFDNDPNFGYIANAFSPNLDGLNDMFLPVFRTSEFTSYRFQVYDRWGSLLFSTTNPNIGWDGTHRGRDCSLGVYVYRIEMETDFCEKAVFEGSVTVVR